MELARQAPPPMSPDIVVTYISFMQMQNGNYIMGVYLCKCKKLIICNGYVYTCANSFLLIKHHSAANKQQILEHHDTIREGGGVGSPCSSSYVTSHFCHLHKFYANGKW